MQRQLFQSCENGEDEKGFRQDEEEKRKYDEDTEKSELVRRDRVDPNPTPGVHA